MIKAKLTIDEIIKAEQKKKHLTNTSKMWITCFGNVKKMKRPKIRLTCTCHKTWIYDDL